MLPLVQPVMRTVRFDILITYRWMFRESNMLVRGIAGGHVAICRELLQGTEFEIMIVYNCNYRDYRTIYITQILLKHGEIADRKFCRPEMSKAAGLHKASLLSIHCV